MNSKRLIRNFCAALALSLFVLAGSQTFAGPINANQVPTVSIKIGDSPEAPTWSYSPPASDYQPATNDGGGYETKTPREFKDLLNDSMDVRIEELQFNPDPFVLNNILVTNTTTSTQIFSAFVGLPTTFGAPNFISGNVRTNVIDGGLDGATIATTSPTPIYQAQIDGVTVQSLQNHPFSVVALAGGSNTASASFGPSLSAIPVTSNIGIQLRFTLTAGDTAAILSRFDVVAVPEPTALALGGCVFALVLANHRRRR